MNHDPLTAVEVRVKRKRAFRLLIILLLIAWVLYYFLRSDFVLALNGQFPSVESMTDSMFGHYRMEVD